MWGFLDKDGILAILLQSKEGEFQQFFNTFSTDKYEIDPKSFRKELLALSYDTKIHHFKITFKTEEFGEILEILYFLLLDKKENLKEREESMIKYINSHFKKNGYYLFTQDIDLILVYKE